MTESYLEVVKDNNHDSPTYAEKDDSNKFDFEGSSSTKYKFGWMWDSKYLSKF